MFFSFVKLTTFLRGLTTALSGGQVADDMKMMKQQMENPMAAGMGQPSLGGKYDPNPKFKFEREGIITNIFFPL